MESRIAVAGSDADTASLWDWLRQEPELRGRVQMGGAAAVEGTMGVPVELLVELTATGAAAALARTLTVWLRQRRSDVTIKVRGKDGRTVSVDAHRVPDPEALLRSVLDATESPEA